MPLFLLKFCEDTKPCIEGSPDTFYQKWVIAMDEQTARERAQATAGDETGYLANGYQKVSFWNDPTKTTCDVVDVNTGTHVIV